LNENIKTVAALNKEREKDTYDFLIEPGFLDDMD